MEIHGGLYINLQKGITRDQAKKVHSKLPEGGTWFTVKGHHVYVKDGKILAGAWGGEKGNNPQKSTKAHVATLQEHVSKKVAKEVKAVVNKVNTPAKTPVKAVKESKVTTKTSVATLPKKGKETVASALGYKPKSAKQTIKLKVNAMDKKRATSNRANKLAKKTRDSDAKPIITTVIKPKTSSEQDTANSSVTAKKQNQALGDWKDSTETDQYLDQMWNTPPVKKLLAKAPEKRSEEEIRKVAGAITTAQDKLSRYVALRFGDKRGLELARQVNKIGNKATPSENVVMQETNMYGDLLQTSRLAMYETLHNVLGGSQNPAPGTNMSAHVIQRMKQNLDRFMQDQHDMPVPEEMRPGIGAVRRAEHELGNSLGHTPTDAEIGEHLKTDAKFKKAPVNALPKWNEQKGEWIATRNNELDPAEKVRLLKIYASRQQAGSLQANVGEEGEKEVERQDKLANGADVERPEDIVDKLDDKKRQKNMGKEIPKALNEMGLDEKERKVFMAKFSEGSETQYTKDGAMTTVEVAKKLGMSQQDVSRILLGATKKLAEAHKAKHPALDRLSHMFKALFMDLMKSIYEYDLVKSLTSWGISTSALEEQFVRIDFADNLQDLKKSLDVTEYIGSYVTTEDGAVHARIIELALPEDNMLYKAFTDEVLQKSMFPHKGKNNHEVNNKASEYVKSNPKLKGLSETQHARARNKSGGGHTWSEQLLLKYPGSAWISWGGKKILVHTGSGEVLYDSANELHRDQHNQGASEDKIDFHHEKEAYSDYHKGKEASVRKEWADHIHSKEEAASKTGKSPDYDKEKEAFAKKHEGISFDGNDLKYSSEDYDPEKHGHLIDHGIQTFKKQMEKMREDWRGDGGIRPSYLADNAHKAHSDYGNFSDEDRKTFDGLDDTGKKKFLGERYLNTEGVKEALSDFHKANHAGDTAKAEEAKAKATELLKAAGSMSSKNADAMKSFFSGTKGDSVAKLDPTKGDNWQALSDTLGQKELSRSKEEASKKFIPEGTYMVGNPITGKTMAVKIGGNFNGGVGSHRGSYTQSITEAFDPDGGAHESINSWGQLGRALGYEGDYAKKLQEKLIKDANSEPDKAFMKQIDEDEYNKYRAKTKLGMQENSQHSAFKLVNQTRDKAGNLQSSTYSMKMPDGSTNSVQINAKGYIQDPVMARLVRQRQEIHSAGDLHTVLQGAIGNRAWVTASFGSDIHIGDALGHHIQLEYDGQGAPRVVGGPYDGSRFMDSKDVPKGAIDPVTGEPTKTLFKNGKLIDRKFTKMHDIPLTVGNDVLLPNGKGGWNKGHIVGRTDTSDWVVRNSQGLQSVYKASELKKAKKSGYTKADSGMATVRLAQKGTHRLEEGELSDDQKKALQRALSKAKIAPDNDSEKGHHEWTDAQRKRLEKHLGKEKLGDDILGKVQTAHTNTLQIHVPENLRSQLHDEGVDVLKDGTARISVGKFEQLRESLGGLSVDHKATKFLTEHFNRKDRVPKTAEELQSSFQPSHVDPKTDFGRNYQAQFKANSFLMDKDQGLYGVQLEGVNHLVTRGRGIVGHGMGVGKTIQGVAAALHVKATALAEGRKPGKSLIVAPAGIRSDWGKEIARHTNSKALFIGSATDRKTSEVGADGKHYWGQEGLKHEHVLAKDFVKNMDKHAEGDHDFHIISYDQFIKHRDKFANSGMYDNILFDEVHAFKNKQGQRGKALAETTDKFKNVWGFSGTPIENDAREVHSLIDGITGGRHELGSLKEFTDNYMIKDKTGKITGIKPEQAAKLGDILANVVQFRGGEDVSRLKTDGTQEKVDFPRLEGSEPTDAHPNPKSDFMGDMVDNSRDHQTTSHYGTKHSIVDYDAGEKKVKSKAGEEYTVPTFSPNQTQGSYTPQVKAFYDKYNELQSNILPESKLQELATASQQGNAQGVGGAKNNYLTASMQLQKFLNAPDANRMYVPGAESALAAEHTNMQAESASTSKKAPKHEAIPFETDSQGHKRYYESDGKGSYLKNTDGSPKLLPPLHHNNPKAQYLKQRVSKYLDNLSRENALRRKTGQVELMPKIALKSSYTTFGTDVIGNVLRDLQREHPELRRWQQKIGEKFGHGEFTGASEDREAMKSGFRGDNSGDHSGYAKNQGNLWAMTVSPAGKEGIDLGNAHAMWHYDQEYNPEKMAQFTARVRRSDSVKTSKAVGRANSVRVESLHVPGTVEDFVFNAEDRKAENTAKVKKETRQAEQSPRYGDTASGMRKTNIAKKPKKATATGAHPIAIPKIERPGRSGRSAIAKRIVSQTNKSLKLVILL